jgi:hypothetical protein
MTGQLVHMAAQQHIVEMQRQSAAHAATAELRHSRTRRRLRVRGPARPAHR